MRLTWVNLCMRCVTWCLVFAACLGWAQALHAEADSTSPVLKLAVAAWERGNYATSLSEFEKVVKQDPDNARLQSEFVKFVVRDAQTKSPDNLAVRRLQRLYEVWAKENPSIAVYPFELAQLMENRDFDKREQYLLHAVALDKHFTEAYSELARLNSGFDDRLAADYARMAVESKPGNCKLQIDYANLLWTIDPAAARKVYRDLISKNAGTQIGAEAVVAFITAADDDREKVALIEQYRREYPKQWKPTMRFNVYLFAAYVTAEPTKGLALAEGILKDLKQDHSGPSSAPTSRVENLEKSWEADVAYAQALVEARSLTAEKKYAEAMRLLEKMKVPRGVGEAEFERQIVLLKANAAADAGDIHRAYDIVSTALLKEMDPSLHSILVEYGAKMGKSAGLVDQDLWAERVQQAERFKAFDLKKLGAGDRLKSADFRGKVLMVDFWFPG